MYHLFIGCCKQKIKIALRIQKHWKIIEITKEQNESSIVVENLCEHKNKSHERTQVLQIIINSCTKTMCRNMNHQWVIRKNMLRTTIWIYKLWKVQITNCVARKIIVMKIQKQQTSKPQRIIINSCMKAIHKKMNH
jgi:hypothetical protein